MILVSTLTDPFQPSVVFHIETSHWFCSAKQITGFYMKHNTGLKWVNSVCLHVRSNLENRFNLFQTSVAFHRETKFDLPCKLIRFDMKCNTGLK